MKLTPISGMRFAGWLVMFTLGVIVWGVLGEGHSAIGSLLVVFSSFILMTPQERSRAMAFKDWCWALVVLALFVAGAVVPRSWGDSWVKYFFHPAFLTGIWLLSAWLVYRRYKPGLEKNEPVV